MLKRNINSTVMVYEAINNALHALNRHFFISLLISLLAGLFSTAQAGNSVVAVRVWPAQDYTRITLESSLPFDYKMKSLQNPDRIVLDIENIDLNQNVKSLSDKILASDPYIKQIRVAKYQSSAVRLVFDLKSEVKPNAFTLAPTGDYKYRLVLDVYPLKDPLMAMVAGRDTVANSNNNLALSAESKAQILADATTLKSPSLDQASPNKELNITKSMEFSRSSPAAIDKTEASNPELLQEKLQTKSDKNSSNNIEIKSAESKSEQPNSAYINKDSRQIIIAIDAGHGGEDPGARGANGSHEKDITLMIAKRLKDKIDSEPNMRGVLTRDSDYFIPLHGRVVKARKMQADLFVSIHADSFTNSAARGSSVFALSERGATSASARYLAKKENESDLIGGVSLDDKDPVLARTLLDLSQTATITDSLKLGKAVLAQIASINTLHTKHVEQAAFAVLKSPDIPSILVETAFISNPEEERKLNDETYQDQLVNSILTGIKKYFSTNPALAKTKVALE